MSVYIKGMSMPKNCDECRIMTYEDTNCISAHELYCGCPIVFRAHPQHEEHRPDYCPLIELPPHGRLIDRDKLHIEMMDKELDQLQPWTSFDDYREVLQMIDDAPIVVESEE